VIRIAVAEAAFDPGSRAVLLLFHAFVINGSWRWWPSAPKPRRPLGLRVV
jgi:hypothetical protein